jgi:hypothetical protein
MIELIGEPLQGLLDRDAILGRIVHDAHHQRRLGRVPVELFGHHRAAVDGLEDVAPHVAPEVPPSDAPWLVELHHLVGDLVVHPEFHVHAELGAERQARRRRGLGIANRAGTVDLAVLRRIGEQVEDGLWCGVHLHGDGNDFGRVRFSGA